MNAKSKGTGLLYQEPFISEINVEGFSPISLLPGAVVFVVGPNNGGKSTFLNEIAARAGHADGTKWVNSLRWDVGSEDDYQAFISKYFTIGHTDQHLKNRRTGNQIGKYEVHQFAVNQKIHLTDHLIRLLNAQSRIELANRTSAPDIIQRTETHAYHSFYYDVGGEVKFSKKMFGAFGKDFRINRTGSQVIGHLGMAPKGQRLSEEYEIAVMSDMMPIDVFGDGVRSYTGILLNSIADARPVTIIDEPEAFLHPPQARRLGFEISNAAKESKRQIFIATHSSDLIRGALLAKNPNTIFLYVDHSDKIRPIFSVSSSVVEEFSKKPFLAHTSALDALFYDQVIICEGEADIMFFRWALEGTDVGKSLDESFWISSYGKAAIPGMFSDLKKIGVHVKCIFDLDVLLSPDIIEKICDHVSLDFSKFKPVLQRLVSGIKVPPAGEALEKIEEIIKKVPEEDDEQSRLEIIRAIKKSAEGLGKSWTLKKSGILSVPRGEIYSEIMSMIEEFREKGIVILEEGEIENYIPEISYHGQLWVRTALEGNTLSMSTRATIERQLTALQKN